MNLEDYIRQELQTLIEDIIKASEAAGQRASGRTYENITETTQRTGELITGEVWAPIYFYTLIRGRGPGKVPYSPDDPSQNMTDIIMEWAGYKGITFSDPDELLRFANAVAWKIRREGSELYRNHLYIDIVDTPVRLFEERLEAYIDSIMDLTITAAFNAENFEGHGYII